jgi:hypothetical protein
MMANYRDISKEPLRRTPNFDRSIGLHLSFESNERQCGSCHFWRGKCTQGHVNRIAKDSACDDFKERSFQWAKT